MEPALSQYLLDSVIWIDHFNGIEPATAFIETHASEIAVSAITRAEVLTGFEDIAARLPIRLLDQFQFLAMDAAVADEAARIRRRYRLKLPDAIQAAFALCHRLKLVTRNTKDFSRQRFDFVVLPYRLPA